MTRQLKIEALETARGAFRDGPHTLEVAPGEIVTWVGPNGCGKSTLIETVAGLRPARAGSVRFGDRLWAERTGAEGKGVEVPPHEREIGVLLQGLGLWPHRTIAEQVALVAGHSSGAGDSGGTEGSDRVARLAEALDLTAKLDRSPDQLSGGEAQRAALLRTLASDAPLYLLDEPTSAQFESSAARIEELLLREAAAGKAIVIATHRGWSEARAYRWPEPKG